MYVNPTKKKINYTRFMWREVHSSVEMAAMRQGPGVWQAEAAKHKGLQNEGKMITSNLKKSSIKTS